MRKKVVVIICIVVGLCCLFLAFYDFFQKRLDNNVSVPRVIIVELSGIRNSESIDDAMRQYFPIFFNEIVPKGTLYTNVYDQNLLFHMAPAQAINTGKIHSFFSEEAVFPSITQYIRSKYKLPQEKVWLFGHWYENTMTVQTSLLGKNTFPSVFSVEDFEIPSFLHNILSNEEIAFFDSMFGIKEERISNWTFWDSVEGPKFNIFKKILNFYHPVFATYVIGAPDAAHYGTFGRYALALRDSDRIIYELRELLLSDEYYKGKTYLFITPDHGRNEYYMNHNQDGKMRNTWLYVYGPGVLAGKHVDRLIHHVDIFSTAAYIMGVDTHATDGEVLYDCFNTSVKDD